MFTSANLQKKMTKNHLLGKLLTIPDCIYVTITFNYPNTSYQMDKKSIKGTKTEHNLLAAFAGESQARSRYTLFAKKAKEEGYRQIAKVFKMTAKQEMSHAELFFSKLEGGVVTIQIGRAHV